MGETRVDLLHLLEDLRDAYPGAIEETTLTEIVANSLDSGASEIALATDPAASTLTIIDNGHGMRRRELRPVPRHRGNDQGARPGDRFRGSRHQARSPRGHLERSRYGLHLQFVSRPDDSQLARLIESTVWINDAHPALAPLATEPSNAHGFVTAFLGAWGGSHGRAAAPPGVGTGSARRVYGFRRVSTMVTRLATVWPPRSSPSTITKSPTRTSTRDTDSSPNAL